MNKREKIERHVADELRRIRGAKSQGEFAKLIGAAQGQVSEWESGKCMPTMPVLIRICQATGTDLSVFVPALGRARAVVREDKEGGIHHG